MEMTIDFSSTTGSIAVFMTLTIFRLSFWKYHNLVSLGILAESSLVSTSPLKLLDRLTGQFHANDSP